MESIGTNIPFRMHYSHQFQLLLLSSIFLPRNNREIAFQQLQITLEQKDFELAKLQQNQSNLMAEISELRRHTKREGVNLDYLKNVVLQVFLLVLLARYLFLLLTPTSTPCLFLSLLLASL